MILSNDINNKLNRIITQMVHKGRERGAVFEIRREGVPDRA